MFKFEHILIPIFVCMILKRFSNAFQSQDNFNSSNSVLSETHSDKSDDPKISQIDKCLELLEQGEREIILSEKKDLNLVLGLTGAGKSTVTAWFAGDDSKLWAKKGTGGKYTIEDEDGLIGNSTFESKTIWPEIKIDINDQEVFYDCPGFDETRGTAHDISQAYFIKKIADHAEKVKIILIVSFSSVTEGETRTGFLDILKHITALIPDIGKFKDSIPMIVTKVDIVYLPIEGGVALVTDEEVIEDIGNFVLETKKFLEISQFSSESETLNISAIDMKANEQKIKLVDALLTKDQNKYSRIGLMRRPSGEGRLSEDEFLVKCKKQVKVIIKDTLKYTPKKNDDFGYSISAVSKNDVGELVEEININVWTNASEMIKEVKDNLKKSLDKPLDFNSDSQIVERIVNLEELIANLDIVKEVEEILKHGQVEVTSNEHFTDMMKNVTDEMKIKLTKDFLFNLENQEKYFKFLQTVSEKPLNNRYAELTAQLQTIIETSLSSAQAMSNEQ